MNPWKKAPEEVGDLVSLTDRLTEELSAWLSAFRGVPAAPADAYVADVKAAYSRIKAGVGRSSDVLTRFIRVPTCPDGDVLVVCIDGIVQTELIDQCIVQPLLGTKVPPDQWNRGAINAVDVTKASEWPSILHDLVSGRTLLFAPGLDYCWVVDTTKYPQRGPERPQTEIAVRGPEIAFNEVLSTNKSQIRHLVHSPALLFWDWNVGNAQRLTVSVAYLEDVANPALVTTVIERLKRVEVASAVTITQIGGLIRDHPRSIFPTVRQTERVDLAVWRLLEGAVVIMMEGDPFVLIAPAPLIDFYRTAMDYSSSWVDTSFVRLIRFVGWVLGIYLPAVYVALAEVNPSVLPSSLFIIMQGSNIGLAFSPIIQVILMILVIETLREAALRLPKVLGTTIGTVGAIVVGTAVVKAGLVDTQIIVIMTLTALSLFATPVYELTATWRVMGFAMLTAGFVLGIVGIVLATMAFVAVLADMRSFGAPYFAPWAPFRVRDWGNAVWRLPWTRITVRPTAPRPQQKSWRIPRPVRSRPLLRRGKMGS